MEKEGHATEMCQYVRCGCRDFIKNFMTLLWSLPSPGNPRASAALEVGNARGYAEYRLGWFKRLLPCCAGCFSALFAAPLLPAPTSQGRGSWGAHSGVFRQRSCCVSADKKNSFADLGRNSKTLACSARRVLADDERRFFPRQLAVLPAARCPRRAWTAVPRAAHLYCQCFGWSLVGFGAAVKNGSKNLSRLVAVASENKAGHGCS